MADEEAEAFLFARAVFFDHACVGGHDLSHDGFNRAAVGYLFQAARINDGVNLRVALIRLLARPHGGENLFGELVRQGVVLDFRQQLRQTCG